MYIEMDELSLQSKQANAGLQMNQKMKFAFVIVPGLSLVVGSIAIGLAASLWMNPASINSVDLRTTNSKNMLLMSRFNQSVERMTTFNKSVETIVSLNRSMEAMMAINNSAIDHNDLMTTFNSTINIINRFNQSLNTMMMLILENHITLTTSLTRGYMLLEDGWIAPFNGFQYKATPYVQSWNESRSYCQTMDSDLMVYGIRDFAMIVSIKRGLGLSDGSLWIGLTDHKREGYWSWINGNRAQLSDATLWQPGQPIRTIAGDGEDCGQLYISNSDINGFLVGDYPCSTTFKAVCEKRV